MNDEKLSAFTRPLTEQELVSTLTDHAHKIAATVLSQPETGENLSLDAQVTETKKKPSCVHIQTEYFFIKNIPSSPLPSPRFTPVFSQHSLQFPEAFLNACIYVVQRIFNLKTNFTIVLNVVFF